MPKSIDITPSPDMLYAIRRTGYDIYQAIFEFVDNSVDALRKDLENNPDAENPYLQIDIKGDQKKKTTSIIVADNATGIKRNFIESGDVFSMGRSATRTESSEATGVFGMGMKAAVQTLGTRLKILTTTSDITNLVCATLDYNQVLSSGKWKASFIDSDEVTETDRKLFRKYVGRKSGTVVIIDDVLDTVPTKGALMDTLRRKTTHNYRHVLNPGSRLGSYLPIEIYTGAKRETKISHNCDPLCVAHEKTEMLIGDKEGAFVEHTALGHTIKIRLSHTKLRAGQKKGSIEGLEDLGYGHGGVVRQGAYFIRNGREIASMPFWKHSSTAGNVFAEISFIDDGIGQHPIRTDYGKKGVIIDDDFKNNVLKYVINPFLKKLGQESRQAAKEATKGTRDEIKKMIEKVALPNEHFGRARQTKEEKQASKVKDIFSKSNRKSSNRKNSKYRGTSIRHGGQDIEFKIEEQAWTSRGLPFNIRYTAGDPIAYVDVNTEYPWVKRALYETTDPKLIARAFQIISTMCISLMYLEDEQREEILELQGVLLNLMDDDYGQRINPEIADMEDLESIIIPELNVDATQAEEMVN